ncbi:MAG TPA: TRAP transporter large permease [Clostridia bacterium]|nr:TRAP transporter large permease [Clostridia bacterium]
MFAIYFLALIVLLILSVPIGVSLGITGMAFLVLEQSMGLEVAIQRIVVAADSFSLMALPLFILSGNIMCGGSISRRLVEFMDSLIGWITGGMSMVTTLASMFFGAISGSCTATTAAIGSIMIPGMNEKGYAKDYGSAVTAASGTLGAVIPPSLMTITYGTITGVSVGALFMAGFLPGILMGISLMIVSYFICKKAGYKSDVKFSFLRVYVSLKKSILAVLMPVIVLGGIYGGIFTPTEAATIAVVYTLIVSVFIYKDVAFKDIPRIFIDSALMSGGIMFLVCTASLFGWTISVARVPQMIASAMLSVTDNPILILMMINVLLLVIGCFLESIATILIMTPILFPIILEMGIDPLQFGIIMCVNICIGTMTPPFGVCLFVSSGISGVPVERIAIKALPYLAILIFDLLLITYIPTISTILPSLFL